MNRKLTVGERIMYVSSEAPVNCIFPVKIRGRIQLEMLERALLKLQLKHPLLRVVIREDEQGAPYYVTDTQIPPIPVLVQTRYTDEDWERVSVDEWYQPFQLQKGPLARVIWLRSDTVSELLLVCPHCICDGTSILTLLRELLLGLDDPDLELPAYPSFNAIEELLPASLLTNRKFKLKAKLFGKIAGVVLRLKAKPVIPVDRGYMVHWKLSPELSGALVHRCKEEGTSLFAAMSVAFLEAFRLVRGEKARNKLICPVDIRRFIPEIAQDELFAFAPIVEMQADTSALTDFWTKTRTFKNTLMEKIDKININEMLYMGEHFHRSLPRMVNFLKTTDGSHDVTLSNMGKLQLPETFRTFELEAVYSPSAGFPWRNPNTLVASSYRGIMDFSFISNDAFLPESEARAIQAKAMNILQEKSRIKQTYVSRDRLLRRFTRKQLYIYFITNLVINAIVPYFGFEDRHAVSLFTGAHSMARFLLPMSVFVPFGITFDILKKCITLLEKKGLRPLLPPSYSQVAFMLKLAGVNALATVTIVAVTMWVVHVSMPVGYGFDGTWLAILSGGIAGGLAILFTWLPLYVVKKLPSA